MQKTRLKLLLNTALRSVIGCFTVPARKPRVVRDPPLAKTRPQLQKTRHLDCLVDRTSNRRAPRLPEHPHAREILP
jgi:hypothetical protein